MSRKSTPLFDYSSSLEELSDDRKSMNADQYVSQRLMRRKDKMNQQDEALGRVQDVLGDIRTISDRMNTELDEQIHDIRRLDAEVTDVNVRVEKANNSVERLIKAAKGDKLCTTIVILLIVFVVVVLIAIYV
eukprot:TRINITY_DN1581_c0_g1_i1.p1 TRINITY_DN1581_c0_g1~~TRINITY_DN1581_c0_g1_i1.p1  ORF type:complete len:132 (-),score=23.20 TRINITY_DN1581_c0_g1_i1:54-449(-)